jgi:NADH-quinone oxidoreductase subunit M
MFALTPVGITGSIVHQLNHGISTGALFLLVGIAYERRRTREISAFGGLSAVMPVFAAVFLLMTLSAIGMPALNGFIGELLVLQGIFVVNRTWAAIAATGIVLGAAYMLWLYQRTMFGRLDNPANQTLRDLNAREVATFLPLVLLAIWIGVYPAPLLRRLDSSVGRIVMRVNSVYGPAIAKAAADCRAAAAPVQAQGGPPGMLVTPPCTTDGSGAAPAPEGGR